jgi:hypothetical protein
VPQPTDQDDPITQAAYIARDITPSLDLVLITHYSDVETLDTLRPGKTDLQTTLAMNRTVARKMLDAGVKVSTASYCIALLYSATQRFRYGSHWPMLILSLSLGPKRRFEVRFSGADGTPTSQRPVNRITLKTLCKKLVE